jgi:hypothetical protein
MVPEVVGGGIYGQAGLDSPRGFHRGGEVIARIFFSGLVAALSTMAFTAPNALADNVCVGVMNQSGCNPAPWNGQLMETWNTPGYYGGWTNGPVACDPFTLQCRGWVQP